MLLDKIYTSLVHVACEQAHLIGKGAKSARRMGQRKVSLHESFHPVERCHVGISHDSALHMETFRGWSNFFMDGTETPKKAVKKSVNRANDCCRMCKCSFNVEYGTGKSGRMSTQNLYIASNRKGSCGEVLASISENIGVVVIKSPSLSECVCLPCARKIRNLCQLFLPELSRTMAYKTRKTVNRLEHKQLHFIMWCQNDHRRNKPTHRAKEAQARSVNCKKH